MKALIVETAFLGDAIVSLSLARELKRLDPLCSITYLVRPEAAELMRCSPDVDEVVPFDKRGAESGLSGLRKKAVELNLKSFDSLFLLHSSARSQRLASMLNIQIKIGFESASRSLTHQIADSGWVNRYQRAALLARAIFPSADIDSSPRIEVTVRSDVDTFIQRFDRTVALAPGSVWHTKEWGSDRFVQLASKLSGEGMGIVVIGDAKSTEVGKQIEDTCGKHTVLELTGRTSLAESAGVIAASTILVANDSAPTHIAVAVGTPVLTIFGPTLPAFGFAPPPGAGEVIEVEDTWCRPCASHGSDTCPIYTHECMAQITVDMVVKRVDKMMSTIR